MSIICFTARFRAKLRESFVYLKLRKWNYDRRRRWLCTHIYIRRAFVLAARRAPSTNARGGHTRIRDAGIKNTGNAFAVRANDDEWRAILSRRHVPLAKNHSFILGSWFGFNGGREGKGGRRGSTSFAGLAPGRRSSRGRFLLISQLSGIHYQLRRMHTYNTRRRRRCAPACAYK